MARALRVGIAMDHTTPSLAIALTQLRGTPASTGKLTEPLLTLIAAVLVPAVWNTPRVLVDYLEALKPLRARTRQSSPTAALLDAVEYTLTGLGKGLDVTVYERAARSIREAVHTYRAKRGLPPV